MPLGIISEEELNNELAKLNGVKPSPEIARVVNIEHGRNKSDRNLPESGRKIISEEALRGSDVNDIIQAFQVSPSSISAYKQGATSTSSYHNPNGELKNHTDTIRTDITERARTSLLAALGEITPEKLKDVKVRDAAGVAKDMSAVIKNMEPSVSNGNLGVNFVFFSPKQRSESEYEVIDVDN